MYLHVSGYRHLHLNQREVSRAGTRSLSNCCFNSSSFLLPQNQVCTKYWTRKCTTFFPPKLKKSVTSNNKIPSRQEAFIKCRALSLSEVLPQGHSLHSPHLYSKTWSDHLPDEEDTRPLKHFYLLGEIGNCRYFTESSFWLKWTRQQLLRSGETFLRQTCTVKNIQGKLAEAANSPCAHSWRNTMPTLQTSHCIKLAAFKTTGRKLFTYSIPSYLTHLYVLHICQSCPQVT